MDNIIFQKTWQDDIEDFFSAAVCCSNAYARVTVDCYITNKMVDKLAQTIEAYLQDAVSTAVWQTHDPETANLTYVSLRFMEKDKHGHLMIEVTMSIGLEILSPVHKACFLVETELGMLYNFSSRIKKLKQRKTDITVELNA